MTKAAGHGGPVSCGTPFGPPVTSESVEPVSPAVMEALGGGCWFYDIICFPSIHDTCDIWLIMMLFYPWMNVEIVLIGWDNIIIV